MDPQVLQRRVVRATNAQKRVEEAENLRLKGNETFKKGDYVRAGELYIEAIDIHGPRPILVSNLAACYNKLGRHYEAEDSATTALEYDPRTIKARFRRATARRHLCHFKAAIRDLESILAQDPGNEDAEKELQLVRDLMQENEGFIDDEAEEEHPRYSQEAWEIASDSDTEDSKHHSLGTSCRFYNRGSCTRGDECRFSHAPDAVSVRDELGRNVCARFLMGKCNADETTCMYSHSRTHLPAHGWWNDPAEVQAAIKLRDWVEDEDIEYDELHSAMLKYPKGHRYAARREREVVILHIHDQFENAVAEVMNAKHTTSSLPPPPSEKFVLVVSFDYEGFFENLHGPLFSALERKIKVVHVRKSSNRRAPEMTLQHLDSPLLVSVLITDPDAITDPKNQFISQKLVTYVKKGGSVVMGGQFPNHIRPDTFNKYIKNFWRLGWKYGSYFRTTFSLNPANEIAQRNPSLAKSHSMKALHISNIDPDMAVYRQTSDSRVESAVFAPVKVKDVSKEEEAPAVCARVGRGLLSFLGDVNGEDSSTKTIMAMLGVLDQPNEPIDAASGAQASTSSSASQQPVAGSTKKNETRSEDSTSKITTRFVVILELDGGSTFSRTYSGQLSELNEKIEVKTAKTSNQAIEYMSSPDVQGVYVVDEGIAGAANIEALEKLVEYIKSGGLVVFGGMFPTDIDKEDVSIVFSAFGLPWIGGSYCKCEAQLNRHHETAVRNPDLSDAYNLTAVNLSGFHAEDLFYEQYFDEYDTHPDFQPPGGDAWEAPILRTRVGNGRLGYIGDASAQPESTGILLAMLELLTPPKGLVRDAKKFMMFISEYSQKQLEEIMPHFLKDARDKLEMLFGTLDVSKPRIVDLLASQDLLGVVVGDASVLYQKNAYFLSQLVQYSKNGGTLIFGWRFCKDVTLTQFRPLFRDNWGLDWDMTSIYLQDTNVKSNPQNILFKVQHCAKLSKSFAYRGIYVKGIAESMAVYYPMKKPNFWKPQEKVFASSVIFTEVDKGRLGYIGSASMDGESRSIIYAMMGLL